MEEALQAVFEDIRTQSADSQLVTPDRWTEIELIPNGMTSQEFVDAVFAYLADPTQATLQQYEPQPEPADGEGAAAADEATAHPKAPSQARRPSPKMRPRKPTSPTAPKPPRWKRTAPSPAPTSYFLKAPKPCTCTQATS